MQKQQTNSPDWSALAPIAPGEGPRTRAVYAELRRLIEKYARKYDVPVSLVQRVVKRESTHRPSARNGSYYGLMQIHPTTARTMGFRGKPSDLLDAETNLKYAVKYLRGAWLLADDDEATAVGWYARGYYYEARDRCMLVETELLDREVRKGCS